MSSRAPYNTPPELGRDLLTAGFWVLCAPILIPAAGSLLLRGIWPGIAEFIAMETPHPFGVSLIWTYLATISLIHFALVSIWSEYAGAGAFAGDVRAPSAWFVGAIIAGPLILLGPINIADLFMEGDWIYAEPRESQLVELGLSTLAFYALALFVQPILEEVTFRGVGMGALLARGIPPVAASVAPSLIFAFLHLQYTFAAMACMFVASLGLSWLRLASGSVGVPIVAHISANCFSVWLNSISTPPAG